jgi:hypothetical protein
MDDSTQKNKVALNLTIEEYMSIGKTKAVRLINGLLDKKLIKKVGTGRNTRYSVR